MKSFFWALLRRLGLGGLVAIWIDGELKTNGWFLSFDRQRSVNAKGEPIPWLTYPFIDFMSPRLQPHFEVFEFGSGSSTLWFAPRVKQVTAVDHDPVWFEQIMQTAPSNVKLILRQDGYARAALIPDARFHIVLIDGIDRNECARHALQALKPDGVIIFDNSDRAELYRDGFAIIEKAGFRRLDFWGMTPGISPKTCTTIFYRADNCFNI